MPSIFNNAESITLLPRTRSWVLVKSTFAGQWQYVPYLVPVKCTDVAAPEVGYADLRYDFGYIKRENTTSFAYYTPYQLLDYYVQIVSQQEGYAPQAVWTGIITDDEIDSGRPDFPSGSQMMRAYQLTHLLDREPIANARVENQEGNGSETIAWMPTFNKRSSFGLSLEGNRSDDEGEDGVYLFSKDGEVWNNYQILEYLLTYYAPDNLAIYLAGQYEILAQYKDLWDFQGMTLWGAINRLVDRRKGLGCYPWTNADGEMYLYIFTLTEKDIKFGTGTLAANQLQTFFEMPSVRPWTHVVGSIPFRKTTINQYDRIVIRGNRAKVTGTYAIADDSLEKGWTINRENDYVAAKGEDTTESDTYRTLDKHRGVFTRFVVPVDWDGQVGDGEGGDKTSLRLKANKDGTMEVGDGPLYLPDKIFLRETPFQVAKLYTGIPPEDDNPEDDEPEFMPMIGFVKTSPVGDAGPEQPKWRLIDRLSETVEDASSASLRPGDKRLSFEIDCENRHQFALNTFDGFTDKEPIFDYNTLAFTATFECDECPQIIIENFSGTPSETGRNLIIDLPGVECWYVAPKTAIDIDPDDDKKLKRYEASNRYIRGFGEDMEKLDTAAAFIAAWYGVRRQAVQIPLAQVGMYVQIGTMITDIRNRYFAEPIRTVVTGRSIDFIAGTTVIETGYNALDVSIAANVDRRRPRKGRLA